jgi:cytochrome c peroxidase
MFEKERFTLADEKPVNLRDDPTRNPNGGPVSPLSEGFGVGPYPSLPLPHPKHQEGGMVFPRFLINEIKRQEGRDLTRFDVDFDIPDHFLPEFPPAIYLKRSDLGDVSQGQLVTVDNYYQLFNGIINPKQLEGLRLLTPFLKDVIGLAPVSWRVVGLGSGYLV